MARQYSISPSPSEGSDPRFRQWADQVSGVVNELPWMSHFSGSSPNSDTTGEVGSIVFNSNPSSNSAAWLKRVGSGNTGWEEIATVDDVRVPVSPIFMSGPVQVANTTRYIGQGANSTATGNISMIVSHAGSITSLHAVVSQAPGAGESATFALFKNGSSQAGDLSVTISGTETQDVDYTGSVSVTTGDLIETRVVTSNAAASLIPRCSYRFVPD